RLDLADSLARHVEVLTHLFERMIALFSDAEAHPEDLLFARCERLEHPARLALEVVRDDRLYGRDRILILDEIAKTRILFLTDRRLEANRLLGDLKDLPHLFERHLHPLGDLLGRRLAAELLDEIATGPDELIDRLDHMDRDADRPRLIGDGARDRLPNPPRRIGREFIAAAILELIDRLHQ